MTIFVNSKVVNIFIKLFSLLKLWWPESFFGAVVCFLKENYKTSVFKTWWEKFTYKEDPAKTSLYRRFLIYLENGISKMSFVAENSILNKCFKVVGEQKLRRFFLLVFAAYLPIEYLLRDKLKLSVASYWEELFILLGIAVLVWRTMKEKNGLSRATSVEAMMLVYMAMTLLLMVNTMPIKYIAIAGLRAQIEYMVWFLILIRFFENKDDAKFLIFAFAGVVLLLSFHGIYQYIIKVEVPDSWTSSTEVALRTRVFSITGSPNIFGSLLIMAAPIFASLIYYLEKPLHKFIALCLTGAICLADLFTFSKGSWVGLLAAIFIFAMFVDKRLLAAAMVAISAIFICFPSITNRITYLFTPEYAERSAAAGRSMRWENGLKLLYKNNKWTGFGLGRFGGAVAMNNQVLDTTEEFQYFYMDNYYLKTLVETGYIGLFFFIMLLLVFVVFGLKSVNRAGMGFTLDERKDLLFRNIGNDKILLVGLFSGLMAVLVHCYFENIFEEPYMMAYFWGLAAALVYMGFYQKKER